MKSLKSRFTQMSKKYQFSSSYICFVEALRSQRFSKRIITFWFNELVDKYDYTKKDKKELLPQLYSLSNDLEEGNKSTQFKPMSDLIYHFDEFLINNKKPSYELNF